MTELPLAYHITFGTYSTRLHGDERGTVDRRHNTPGEPVLGHIESWQQVERSRLRFAPIVLTTEQQMWIEAATPSVCKRGGWTHHAAACGPDHVHVLLSADADGGAVRRWLKIWLGQALSKRWALEDGQRWWADGGSVKWVWDEAYFEQVREYIERQRATR